MASVASHHCKGCRDMQKTSIAPKVSTAMVEGFRVEVLMDLIFWRVQLYLYVICRGTRLGAVQWIKDKKPITVQEALDTCWVCFFGFMTLLIYDRGGEFNTDDWRT